MYNNTMMELIFIDTDIWLQYAFVSLAVGRSIEGWI